jgi:two-component system sensor histidine kinase PilS (NtrC family)
VVTGIQLGAVLRWLEAAPEQTLMATVVFVVGLMATAVSFWWTEIAGREAGVNFTYGQVLLDVVLVTAIVHLTGGGDSAFAPLYILVIASGAILLPLPGGVLIGALASLLYFADIVWGHGDTLSITVLYQVLIFATVAVATGWLGDRVRRAGAALGEVQSELRQLRLDTDDILGALSSGIIIVDSEGRLAYINPAGEQLLKVPGAQWLGAPVVTAVAEVSPGLGSLLRRSLDDRIPFSRYKTVARVEGQTLTLGVTTTVLQREGGGLPSVTAVFQDISDQERLDELNRRTQRLEAVAELSASLAHEIKNPLASIRSAVEQIGDGRLDDEDRGVLKRLVTGESDRLSRLLSEFIEFSRTQIGNVEPVDLGELVEGAVALVWQHPAAGDIDDIRVKLPEANVVIQGDGDLLHRAVFNLLLNAIQFAGDSGTVELELAYTTDSEIPAELGLKGGVRLSVSDSGPGIDAELAERIFDPFFTTREGGSGLGLAMVHRTVEGHKGVVTVDRSSLGGARFDLYLPGAKAGS